MSLWFLYVKQYQNEHAIFVYILIISRLSLCLYVWFYLSIGGCQVSLYSPGYTLILNKNLHGFELLPIILVFPLYMEPPNNFVKNK